MYIYIYPQWFMGSIFPIYCLMGSLPVTAPDRGRSLAQQQRQPGAAAGPAAPLAQRADQAEGRWASVVISSNISGWESPLTSPLGKNNNSHIHINPWKKTWTETKSGWWFGTFFIFPYIGNSNPDWLIFFRGVEATHQLCFWVLFLVFYGDSSTCQVRSLDSG